MNQDCREMKVNCFEFDLHQSGSKNKNRRDHVRVNPDPDKTRFCGVEGPSDVLISSKGGNIVFKPNGDGNAGTGFACSIECMGVQSPGACSE